MFETMHDIVRDIEGDRKSTSFPMPIDIDVMYTGVGLAPEEPVGPLPDVDHHVISSKPKDNLKDAIIDFWEEYKRQSPHIGGELYWRVLPRHVVDKNFDTGEECHTVQCRFSVVREPNG